MSLHQIEDGVETIKDGGEAYLNQALSGETPDKETMLHLLGDLAEVAKDELDLITGSSDAIGELIAIARDKVEAALEEREAKELRRKAGEAAEAAAEAEQREEEAQRRADEIDSQLEGLHGRSVATWRKRPDEDANCAGQDDSDESGALTKEMVADELDRLKAKDDEIDRVDSIADKYDDLLEGGGGGPPKKRDNGDEDGEVSSDEKSSHSGKSLRGSRKGEEAADLAESLEEVGFRPEEVKEMLEDLAADPGRAEFYENLAGVDAEGFADDDRGHEKEAAHAEQDDPWKEPRDREFDERLSSDVDDYLRKAEEEDLPGGSSARRRRRSRKRSPTCPIRKPRNSPVSTTRRTRTLIPTIPPETGSMRLFSVRPRNRPETRNPICRISPRRS